MDRELVVDVKVFGKVLRNLRTFRVLREVGFAYIVNPDTGELHRVDAGSFFGSHNLAIADLEQFIGLTNLGAIPAHLLPDGAEVPVYDIDTGELIGTYEVNRCKHCFPQEIQTNRSS